MLKPLLVGVMMVAVLGSAGAVLAQAPTAPDAALPAPAKNDYASDRNWLCRPGNHDACDVDLSTTVVAAEGRLTPEPWKANPAAPIDCFYVYPTVSTDTTPNSDMTADPAELNVVRQQFARFGSACRVYAPLYRQVTLAGLRRVLAPGASVASLGTGLQYVDVLDAWKYYIEHDNKGRGFVLIAHSQGSFILTELIRREIDGRPIQSQMLSAMLMGTTVTVPRGKDVGGSFEHVPLCRSGSQLGCVITFASFRSTLPPPANTLFGKVPEAGMAGACTNPAALSGGSCALHAYLSVDGNMIVNTAKPKPWVVPDQPIGTPWVSVPGLLTATCATNDNATFLEITVHGNPSDPRTDDIVGDLGAAGAVQANWGLHLIDVNLAIGNLIDIVGQQAKAFAAKAQR